MNVAPEELHSHPTRRDIVMCEGRRYPRVRPCHATWFFFLFSRLAPTWADSRWIGLTQAVSIKTNETGKTADSGKKKKCKTHRLNFSSLHPNTKLQLSLTLSLIFHSLCALCLCLCLVLFVFPVAVRHSVTSVHSFFSSLSRILNSGIDIRLSILV